MKRTALFYIFVLFCCIGVLAAQGESGRVIVSPAVRHDTSPPLRDLPRPAVVVTVPNREVPNVVDFVPPGAHRAGLSADPLAAAGPIGRRVPAPAPIASFAGLSDDDNALVTGGRVVPPDTQGDVGLNHYVQMVNLIFAVYDKNGNIVPGGQPRPSNDIWQGFGGICETNNDGDPVVLYDHLADRWMFSQFAFFDSNFRGHECIAVSATSDPTGPYHRYDFLVSPGSFDFPDYPKLGLWPDGYYMSANEFDFLAGFNGAIVVAFERDQMLNGLPANMVRFGPLPCATECFFSLQPSHLEGPAPAAGTPNTFVQAFDDETWGSGGNPDGYRLWDFAVNWASPGSSTFTSLGQVNTTEFDANLCGFGACVPQRDSTELLDTLCQFTMFRAQARDYGSHRSIAVSHTVDLGGDRAGVRWTELRNTGGGWFLHNTGTIGPNDGLHRWMGSAALDSAGNMGVGYSVSSGGIYPEIRYTVVDSSGTPTDEGLLHAGTGSQTGSSNRWGDYSSMSVDPADGCTFWYTQEYYADPPAASFDFKTRIGSFRAAGCGAPECSSNAECDDGVACTVDSCNSGQCVNTPDDAFCDDGAFCNGAETCDPVNDCQPGAPVDCDDGVGCTDDSCNEGTDQCDNVPNDALCPDDGLFCNGAEFCDPANDCSSTGDPCGPGEACNESTDTCDATPCDNDGVCESGEDCNNCPNDCVSGTSSGAVCGNGVCEAGDGEDCVSCPSDCNGVQNGRPSERFCCGDGDGQNPVGCSDARCSSGGFMCTDVPQPGGAFCCGLDGCESGEDCGNCALDCTTEPGGELTCGDGLDNDCNNFTDCADAACSGDPACQAPDCSQFGDKKSCNAQTGCRWDNRNKVCVPQ